MGQPPSFRREYSALRRAFAYASGYKAVLAVIAGLAVLGALLNALQPWALQEILDGLGDGVVLGWLVGALVALVILQSIVSAIHVYVTTKLSSTVVLGLRQALATAILHLPIAELSNRSRGDLLSRFNNDTTTASGILDNGALRIATASIMLVTAVVCMLLVDAPLFAITIVAILLGSAAVLLSGQAVRSRSSSVQASLAEMSHRLDRTLASTPLIRAYGATQHEESRLTDSAATVLGSELKLAKLNAVVQPIGAISMQLALVGTLAVGGYRVSQGALTIGSLIAFVMYLFMMVTPVMQIVNGYVAIQTGLAAMDRIDEILAIPSEADSQRESHNPLPTSTAPPRTAISFRAVQFAYPGDRDSQFTVGPLDLDIYDGQRIALVGPSGSGKSTVISLLERFYVPTHGTILVDGKPHLDYELESYRNMFGYVEQNSPALAGSLEENLALAHVNGQASMSFALATVGLFDDQPASALATDVGHGGAKLSGGEKQRLAWARMLLANRKILLLDEPSASVDSLSEARLHNVLDTITSDVTVIMVAHRLAGVADFDRILVMDNGQIIGGGTHQELIESCLLYRKMAAMQGLVRI